MQEVQEGQEVRTRVRRAPCCMIVASSVLVQSSSSREQAGRSIAGKAGGSVHLLQPRLQQRNDLGLLGLYVYIIYVYLSSWSAFAHTYDIYGFMLYFLGWSAFIYMIYTKGIESIYVYLVGHAHLHFYICCTYIYTLRLLLLLLYRCTSRAIVSSALPCSSLAVGSAPASSSIATIASCLQCTFICASHVQCTFMCANHVHCGAPAGHRKPCTMYIHMCEPCTPRCTSWPSSTTRLTPSSHCTGKEQAARCSIRT